MKIFKTKADVDNLAELRRRKSVLSVRIKTQRAELSETVRELREELKPAAIIQHTLSAFAHPIDSGIVGSFLQNPSSLRLVSDFAITTLMRNSRSMRLVRAVAPVVIQALPGLVRITKNLFKRRRAKHEISVEPIEAQYAEHSAAHRNGV